MMYWPGSPGPIVSSAIVPGSVVPSGPPIRFQPAWYVTPIPLCARVGVAACAAMRRSSTKTASPARPKPTHRIVTSPRRNACGGTVSRRTSASNRRTPGYARAAAGQARLLRKALALTDRPVAHAVGRDREACIDATVDARFARGVDTHDLAAAVEQRATAIAVLQLYVADDVRLASSAVDLRANKVPRQPLGLERSAGVADGEEERAGLQLPLVAPDDGGQIAGVAGDEGEVEVGISGNHAPGSDVPVAEVRQRDGCGAGQRHDVLVRQHPARVDDDARASRVDAARIGRGGDAHQRGQHRGERIGRGRAAFGRDLRGSEAISGGRSGPLPTTARAQKRHAHNHAAQRYQQPSFHRAHPSRPLTSHCAASIHAAAATAFYTEEYVLLSANGSARPPYAGRGR